MKDDIKQLQSEMSGLGHNLLEKMSNFESELTSLSRQSRSQVQDGDKIFDKELLK